MKLKYKGFLIKSISYDLKHTPKSGDPYSDMAIDDGQVAMSKGNPPSVIITMNAKAFTKNKNEKDDSQTLSFTVDCIFEIESKESDIHKIDGPEFRKLVETYGMNFCMMKAEELVKQITSIDYGRPMIVRKVSVPSGIKLITPDEYEKDTKKTDK